MREMSISIGFVRTTKSSFPFFFNDTATTEIYTLSLHDALPISARPSAARPRARTAHPPAATRTGRDRKSTRLNSSHPSISYAVFCLKNKNHVFAERMFDEIIHALKLRFQLSKYSYLLVEV